MKRILPTTATSAKISFLEDYMKKLGLEISVDRSTAELIITDSQENIEVYQRDIENIHESCSSFPSTYERHLVLTNSID